MIASAHREKKLAFTDGRLRQLSIKKRLAEVDQYNLSRERWRSAREGLDPEKTKPPKKVKQTIIWDEGQEGLGLLISAGGTETFVSRYGIRANGRRQWVTRTIGRFGEMVPQLDRDRENPQTSEARRIV